MAKLKRIKYDGKWSKATWKGVIARFDAYVARGFSAGLGHRNKRVCVENALCAALGMPPGDDPTCVDYDVRTFKISLNDANWSTPEARAAGLRDLGIAQIGSLGLFSVLAFSDLIDKRIRQPFIDEFRKEGGRNILCDIYNTRGLIKIINIEARNLKLPSVRKDPDYYLNKAARIALDILREKKSPGCKWI